MRLVVASVRWAAKFVAVLFSLAWVFFFPWPYGPGRRLLAGRANGPRGLEFYGHTDTVCFIHLIWFGWLTAGLGFAASLPIASPFVGQAAAVSNIGWVAVAVMTLLVMGIHFDRNVCGVLFGAAVVLVLTAALVSLLYGDWLTGELSGRTFSLPDLSLGWGVPACVSSVLASALIATAWWRSIDDVWSIRDSGNFIEYRDFQGGDMKISKGAKNIAAVYDCLLRRYLLFGYGRIELRSSHQQRAVHQIDGVFFAGYHVDALRRRLGTTDVTIDDEEEELDSLDAA